MIQSFIITILLILSPQSNNPQNAKVHYEKGFSLIQECKYVQAVEEFDNAIKLDKNCKEAYLGKGIAYYRSGDYNRREIYPEEYIKKALKIDKNYFDAKIHLAWCYYYKDQCDEAVEYMSDILENEDPSPELYFETAKFYDFIENYYFKKYKSKTFQLLKTAYETGCSNPECLYMLGWKYFVQDSTDQALKLYNKGLKIEKEESNYKPLLDLAVIYYNLGDNEKSNGYFDNAVNKMPEAMQVCFKKLTENYKDDLFRKVQASLALKFYPDYHNNITEEGRVFLEENFVTYEKYPVKELAFMCLLTEAEKDSYKKQKTVSEKSKFIKDYFITRDLTPFDKTENIREEFEKRFGHILQAYRARTPEGFDDRGKIYLKYGEPDNSYKDSGIITPDPQLPVSDASGTEEGRIVRYNRGERIKKTTEFNYNENINITTESWIYIRLDFYFSFDFISKDGGTTYEEVPYLIEAVPRRGTNIDNYVWLTKVIQIYENRSWLGGIYSQIPDRIRLELQGQVDPSIAPFAACIDVEMERIKLQNSIPTFFPTENEEKHLNFNFRTADFKHGRKGSRNELYYGLNLDRLKFEKEGERYKSSVNLFYKLLDDNLNIVKLDSLFFTLSSQTEDAKGIAFNQLNYVTEPGEYTLVLQMRNPEGSRLGILTEKINIDDYSKEKLNLSDIQFSFDIKDAQRNDRYIKNGLNVKPFPFYEVSSAKPLYLYYEIYNLQKNRTGKTNYEIEYNVRITEYKKSFLEKVLKLGDDKKESISMSIKESGTQSNIFKYTAIDLSSLKLGKYNLNVRIKDLKTGETAEKTISFLLTK